MAIYARNLIQPFGSGQLEGICRVLADTATGLTGNEIGRLLGESGIEDVDPTNTKWKRLFNAFVTFQNRHRAGNHVVVFINRAMDPATHIRTPDIFDSWRDDLNAMLSG